MPEISVIVPVYNAETTLSRCVDSLLSQTFTDFELILIDDGSEDRSAVICEKYAQMDSRVKVLHTPNGGVSRARNHGLSAARGEYIAFCDSDDFVNRDFLKRNFYSKADLSICGCYFTDRDGVITGIARQENECLELVTPKNLLRWFEHGSLYSVWSCIFRRSIIEKYNITFNFNTSRGEDTIFVLEYVTKCSTVHFTSDILYYYVRYGANTLTTTTNLKTILSLDYIDCYLEEWFKANGIECEKYSNVYFWSHFEIYEHFQCILRNTDMSIKNKYAYYKAIWRSRARKKYLDEWTEKENRRMMFMLRFPSPALLTLYEFVRRIVKQY